MVDFKKLSKDKKELTSMGKYARPDSTPYKATLNEDQTKAFEAMEDFCFRRQDDAMLCLKAFAGTGKLQPYTEPVLTPNGWELMRNIKKGSLVINKQGQPVPVLDVFPGKDLNIYTVHFSDGTFTECCEDHLWEVQTGSRRQKGSYVVMPLKEIMKDYQKKTKKHPWKYSVDLCGAIQFTPKKTELHPYLLGLLLGNGYLPEKGNVTFSCHKDVVREFYDNISSILPFGVTAKIDKEFPSAPNTGRIVFNSIIKKYLKELGLLGLKSGVKYVPNDYLFNSIQARKNILAGLMDTDGCIQDFGTKKKMSFSTTSFNLMENVLELIRSLGGTATNVCYDRTKEGKGIEYDVRLRTPYNPFVLSTKARVYSKFEYKALFIKKIVRIEYKGKEDGQCLLVDDPSHLYITRGYTVTHNTYLIARFLQYCSTVKRIDLTTHEPQRKTHREPEIALTAPTNKAVQVLRESSDKQLTRVASFDTIHSLLGLKEQINDSGEVEFRNDTEKNMKIEEKQIVVVDETSMLQDELFYSIKRFCPSKKIIYLGDHFQIPPVGKEDSEPFLNPDDHNIITIGLNKIMRQKENSSIIDLSMYVRTTIDHDFEQFNHGDVMVRPSAEKQAVHALIKTAVCSTEFGQSSNYLKLVAWRNSKVRSFNQYIRRMYFDYAYPNADQSNKVLPHDRMITMEPYTIETGFGEIEIVLTTNQEFLVESYTVLSETFAHVKGTVDLKFYDARVIVYDVDQEKDIVKKVKILHEDSEKLFAKEVQRLKDAAMYAPSNKRGFFWREYYKFKRTFCVCDYSYAVTCHKSQGSTYNFTVVDSNDILSNSNVKESRRILYTGITRAKEQLILIN